MNKNTKQIVQNKLIQLVNEDVDRFFLGEPTDKK